VNDDEAWWLKADYSINCNSQSHKLYELFTAFAALIYSLGIPALYVWKLMAARKNLNPGVGQRKLLNTKAVRYIKREEENEDGKFDREYGYVLGNTGSSRRGSGAGNVNLKLAMQKLKVEGKKPELIRLDEKMAKEIAIKLREDIEKTTPSVKRLSLLYSSYEPRCWWFEIFETLRRLTLDQDEHCIEVPALVKRV